MLSPQVLADPAGSRAAPVIAVYQSSSPEVVGSENAAAPSSDYTYQIGPEDRLQVTVRKEEDVSGDYDVRPDGRIAIPLVGDIIAAGRTTEELAMDIEEALKQFIADPFVSVRILRAAGTYSDRIRIIGKAVEPQTVPYRNDLTALSLLTQIGGLPERAAANDAYILRRKNGTEEKIHLRLGDVQSGEDPAANKALEPGDILVVPESFIAGEREIEGSVTASQSYSDNVNLSARPFRQHSYISEIIPALQLSMDGARVRAELDASLRVQHRTNVANDYSVAPEIRGTTNIEVVEDLFYTDLSADVSRQVTDTRRGQSSTLINIANTQTVQVYRASPYFRFGLGDIADVETRYRGSLIQVDALEPDPLNPGFIGGQAAVDSLENTGSITLSSPRPNSRFAWRINGQYSHFDQNERASRERKEATVRLEYEIVATLTLIARGGYQKFSGDDFGRNVDDPLYMGGVRWTPTSRTSLEVIGGQRDGATTVSASFNQLIGQSLIFNASFDERVQIDQERLVENLPETPDDFDPNDPSGLPFSLRGSPTRTQTAQASLNGQFGATTFSIFGSWQTSSLGVEDEAPDNEEVYIARAQLNQPITRDVSLSAFGTWIRRDFSASALNGLPRRDTDYRTNLSLSYLGFRRFVLSANYGFSTRNSTLNIQEYSENTVGISLTVRF